MTARISRYVREPEVRKLSGLSLPSPRSGGLGLQILKSIRQLARHHKMDPRTMRHLVKEDLGQESRVFVQRPLLTADSQEMRKERCQKLINKLKISQPPQVQTFSDENIFTVDVAINCYNSRYLTDLPVADVDPDVCILPNSFFFSLIFLLLSDISTILHKPPLARV
jgi:hypothetical protein